MKVNLKKTIKITLVLILLLIIFINFYQVSAFGFEDLGGTPVANDEAKTVGNRIITLISTAGSIISVIVLVVLGIKYMMGSAEEKAEYKSSLMPYVIGSMIVFAASTIAGIIYQMASNF